MSAGSLSLHAVGVSFKLPFPTSGDFSTATVSLRLRKPDGSDIAVPAEEIQPSDLCVVYKTRKGDINHYGNYTLYGTIILSGRSYALLPGSFRAEPIRAPANQSGVG